LVIVRIGKNRYLARLKGIMKRVLGVLLGGDGRMLRHLPNWMNQKGGVRNDGMSKGLAKGKSKGDSDMIARHE